MHSERLAYIEHLNDEQELSVSDVAELIETIKRLAGHSRLLGAKEFHALERARSYIELTYNEEGGEESAEAKHDLDQFDAVMRLLVLAMEAPEEREDERQEIYRIMGPG